MKSKKPLQVVQCIDCNASFEMSRTKISPRCEKCRAELHSAVNSHGEKVKLIYAKAERRLSGPFILDEDANEGHRYQQPPFPTKLTSWIEGREQAHSEIESLMSDTTSYGSAWQEYEFDESPMVEDLKGSVIYDSKSGLRLTPATVRSPRLPSGISEGRSTTIPEVADAIHIWYRDINLHPWFTEHPFWAYLTIKEIRAEMAAEILAIKKRVDEAVARESTDKAARAGLRANKRKNGLAPDQKGAIPLAS